MKQLTHKINSSPLLSPLIGDLQFFVDRTGADVYVVAESHQHKQFMESPHILFVLMNYFSGIFKHIRNIRIVYGAIYNYAATGIITLL